MGSGSSVSKENRKVKEAQRFAMVHQVEKFVINSYACCPRVESMKLVLSSKMAVKAFTAFIKSEHAEEILLLFQMAEEMAKPREKISTYALSKDYVKMVATYIQASNAVTSAQVMVSQALHDDLVAFVSADLDELEPTDYFNEIKSRCQRICEECTFLMARDQFHRFILSKFYKSWRAAESSHARATTIIDATKNVKDAVNSKEGFSFKSFSSSGNRRKKHEDLTVRAFMNVDSGEIGRLLGTESWLAALLAAAEGLALCFTMATARADRRGFPLMYVNKYFEKVTGYSRSEVLGKNCKFLQCASTEKEQVDNMTEALKNAKPTTSLLMNRTFHGRVYKNLVAIRPVFDEKNVYRYVIGIQIDVSKEVDECVSKIKLAEGLMAMLPSTLLEDEED